MFVNNKLSSINGFYFGKFIYKEDFFFINRINLELSSIFEKINKYFSEDRFSLFKAELLAYSLKELQQYDENKFKEIEQLYKSLSKKTNGLCDTKKDYHYRYKTFWQKLFGGTTKKYYYLSNWENYKKVNLNKYF